uniref:Mitochondrial fission 1 protein n=1 Tax=Oryza barthii TaxID=65489 RepID=A0A0D3EYR0_9ORYZ
MEAKIGRLVGAMAPSSPAATTSRGAAATSSLYGVEREVAEAATEEHKNVSIMRLSWALVHSRNTDDVNRGIAMLQASLGGSKSPLEAREKLYLLAVGHYRNGDYPRSRQLLEHCLEIQPGWGQALSLKKTVEDKIAKGVNSNHCTAPLN